MNKFIILEVVVLLSISGFCGCIGPTNYIRAIKLTEEPDNYVNMSEQQMVAFPHLKEAILKNESIETPLEEFNKLSDFLNIEDTRYIKYQNEFYKIRLVCAD